jgi:hypothetical protein
LSISSFKTSAASFPPISTWLGTHISFMWFLDSCISLLIFLVFGFRVHLFPDAANSELRESVAMIVGLFLRVVFSIVVMIACCSALYIEDWDLIFFFDNLVICDSSESNLVVLQRSIRDVNSALMLSLLAPLGMAHMVRSMVSFSSTNHGVDSMLLKCQSNQCS